MRNFALIVRIDYQYALIAMLLLLAMLCVGCRTDGIEVFKEEKRILTSSEHQHARLHRRGFGVACRDIKNGQEREHCQHHQHALLHRLLNEEAAKQVSQITEEGRL